MEDRNAHFESIREHLVPNKNILVQQHGGRVYKAKYSEGRFLAVVGVRRKKFRIDDRLDCGVSRASIPTAPPRRALLERTFSAPLNFRCGKE